MTYRPIDSDDYLRVYTLIHAVSAWSQSDEPLAEILRVTYEDDVPDRPFVKDILDDPVPERFLANELWHASLVLETLWRGGSEIPDSASAPLSPCSIPGCPELTYGTYCLWHELERKEGE